MKKYQLNLFADYFQFYLKDENSSGDLSGSWTQEAVDRLLAVAPGIVGVGTVRNMTVPVRVEILETEPDLDFESWDHVTECSLDVPSGSIVIAGCTDYLPSAERVSVPPGVYRVRVSYGSLNKLSDDGLEGEDHYRLQLWMAGSTPPRVLKQRAT